MAKRGNHWRGFKKVSGAHVGKIAVKVYTCRGCGVQHRGKKPPACIGCGRMDFSKFDSQGEAGRWATLELLERAGKISQLQSQVRFDLMASRVIDGRHMPVKSGRWYVADFVYFRDGETIVEDFKGAITDVAALKISWMAAMGIHVKLTGD